MSLAPCRKCGAPRTENIAGCFAGRLNRAPLCVRCKQINRIPKFLRPLIITGAIFDGPESYDWEIPTTEVLLGVL